VGLLALGALLVPGRRRFWAIVLSGLCTVALLSLLRLALFADILPNTFWAKRWPPYAAFGPGDRWAGAKELLRFFKAPFVALGIAALQSAFSGGRLAGALRSRRAALAILAAPLMGAVVMGRVTGKHWGYPGRMPYFAFPPTLLLLSVLLSDWVRAARP